MAREDVCLIRSLKRKNTFKLDVVAPWEVEAGGSKTLGYTRAVCLFKKERPMGWGYTAI